MKTGKGEPLNKWIKYLGEIYQWIIPFLIGWTVYYSTVRGTIIFILWLIFSVGDVWAYSRSIYPLRRTLVGYWVGSGYVALYVAGINNK